MECRQAQGAALIAAPADRDTPLRFWQQGMGEVIWACADIGQTPADGVDAAMAAQEPPWAIMAQRAAQPGVRPAPQKSAAASRNANTVVRRR